MRATFIYYQSMGYVLMKPSFLLTTQRQVTALITSIQAQHPAGGVQQLIELEELTTEEWRMGNGVG